MQQDLRWLDVHIHVLGHRMSKLADSTIPTLQRKEMR